VGDGASFTKYPLGSSNPFFGAFKYLNMIIMQYMCHWNLAHTGKNMVSLSTEVFNSRN